MARPNDLKTCSGCARHFHDLDAPIYGGPELHGHAFCNAACKFSYVIQELTRLRGVAQASQVALGEATTKLDTLPGLLEAALLAARFLRENPQAGPGIATVAQALRQSITQVEMALAGHPNTPPDSADRAEAELASRPGWGGDS